MKVEHCINNRLVDRFSSLATIEENFSKFVTPPATFSSPPQVQTKNHPAIFSQKDIFQVSRITFKA